MSTWLQSKLGGYGMGAGLIWTAYVGTQNVTAFNEIIPRILYARGPLHALGISMLIWLHAKYRRSVAVNRA